MKGRWGKPLGCCNIKQKVNENGTKQVDLKTKMHQSTCFLKLFTSTPNIFFPYDSSVLINLPKITPH